MTYSAIFILNALKLKDQNYSLNKIVKELKLISNEYEKTPKKSIIALWIKLYKKNINLLDIKLSKLYSRIKNKEEKYLNFDILQYILELVRSDPFIKRENIKYLVLNKFNIKVSLNKISFMYRKLKLTWKKPKKHCVKDESYLKEIQESRDIFREEIKRKTIESIVSIDESGFNNLFLYTKGLSEKGVKINVPVTSLKEKNHTLILAIKTSGIVHHFETNKTINNTIFYDFISDVIDKLDNNIKHTFIFDNVPFHTMSNIKELIDNSGNELMLCPKYSPNHNPIENLFSIIKNNFKKNVKKNKEKNKNGRRNYNYIKKMIILSIDNIQKNYNYIFLSIFKRAFNYDYTDIVKELRDRLIFKNNENYNIIL